MLKEVKTCPEVCARAEYVEYVDMPDGEHFECKYHKNVGHRTVMVNGRVLCRRFKPKEAATAQRIGGE